MHVIRVESPEDARLEGYALIGDERRLAARGEFVAEGRFVVSRLIEGGRHALRSLLLNEAALSALNPVLAGVDAPIYVCAPRFFERLTGHHFHRGCLGLAARPPRADALELAGGASALVALDRVADADNIGSVFRCALAFGVDAVWLGPGCADPLGRKAIRTSMAATLRVPFAALAASPSAGLVPSAENPGEPVATWPGCLDHLRERGFELIALSPRQPALDLRSYVNARPAAPFCLLVGTEGDGLGPDVEARATRRLRIAMRPGVDSLNLGVATGIALHALARDPGDEGG